MIQKKIPSLIKFILLTIKNVPIVVVLIALYVLLALVPSIQVLATANFTDKAISIFNNIGSKDTIYLPILLIGICLGSSFVLNELIKFVKLYIYQKYNIIIREEILMKRGKLVYPLIEEDDTWDLIQVVGKDPAQKIIDGLVNSLDIISYIIRIMGFVLIISVHIWWIGLLVSIISIPMLVLSHKSGKLDYEAFEEAEEYERRAEYLQEVLSSRECAEERKLFQYTSVVNAMWVEEDKTMREIIYNAFKKIFIQLGISNSASKIITIIIGILLLYPLERGDMTAGLYIALLGYGFSLINILTYDLAIVIQNFVKNDMFYNSFNKLLKLDEEADILEMPAFEDEINFNEIIFKNVDFTYPGTTKKILDKLNLSFKKGNKYALVGENGAGKSTIVKLLIGLYDSYDGEILIDGVEFRKIAKVKLKSFFQVVFQDFSRYELSIENFLLLGLMGRKIDEEEKKSLMKNALITVGLWDKVNSFEYKEKTLIGRLEDNSIDLSGGEWQKLILARTIISNAKFTILDEPTSAIDPINEAKLYKLFEKTTSDKSSLIITHRLGAARIADEIMVLQDGKISEQGTHESLLNENGIYAEMFNTQRSWYNE